jgi:F-type H+-transporting ATPase subunit b
MCCVPSLSSLTFACRIAPRPLAFWPILSSRSHRSIAQETATLEHANFQLAQESAVKSELKAVLDSWVRYEQQQRESEQAALVKAVQTAVDAEVAKPAFRKQLLEEAVARVEALSKAKSI